VTALPLCPTCRALGECRLGVGPAEVDPADSSVQVPARCPAAQAGGPRTAHGGWTAAVLDDVMGRLLRALDQRTVTGELTVRYLRPVPVEVDLHVRARLGVSDQDSGSRDRHVTAELALAGSEEPLATAVAVFVTVPEEPGRTGPEAVPVEPCTAESVAAALPEDLRAAFLTDHRRVLETWRAQAEALRRRPAPSARPAEPPGWAGLMDDWEL
jgi:acyl-coenzyme A thioesterase PaaI-like protein